MHTCHISTDNTTDAQRQEKGCSQKHQRKHGVLSYLSLGYHTHCAVVVFPVTADLVKLLSSLLWMWLPA